MPFSERALKILHDTRKRSARGGWTEAPSSRAAAQDVVAHTWPEATADDTTAGEDAVAIDGVELAEAGPPAGFLRRDQGRASPTEHIEHDLASARDVADGVRDQLHRLDRRVQRQFRQPAGPPRVHAAVLPHIRAIPALLPQFEGVAVGRRPVLEGEDEFMARAIEGAHATVVLDPDDQILELLEDGLAGREDLGQVAPVHTDVVDRAVNTVRDQPLEGPLQKLRERLAAHLPGRHRKLAVPDLA